MTAYLLLIKYRKIKTNNIIRTKATPPLVGERTNSLIDNTTFVGTGSSAPNFTNMVANFGITLINIIAVTPIATVNSIIG